MIFLGLLQKKNCFWWNCINMDPKIERHHNLDRVQCLLNKERLLNNVLDFRIFCAFFSSFFPIWLLVKLLKAAKYKKMESCLSLGPTLKVCAERSIRLNINIPDVLIWCQTMRKSILKHKKVTLCQFQSVNYSNCIRAILILMPNSSLFKSIRLHFNINNRAKLEKSGNQET